MILLYECDGRKVYVEVPDTSELREVLDSFDGFLKAIGYVFNGRVEIVNNEEKT